MAFLNEAKLARAQAVVANPAKFHIESVERVALARVNGSLSDAEKAEEVYKTLGGAIGPDKVPEKGKKK